MYSRLCLQISDKSFEFNGHKCHENILVSLEIKSRISINLSVKRKPTAIGWYSKYMEDLESFLSKRGQKWTMMYSKEMRFVKEKSHPLALFETVFQYISVPFQ